MTDHTIRALAHRSADASFTADELAKAVWRVAKERPFLVSTDGEAYAQVVESYLWAGEPEVIDRVDGSRTVLQKGDWVVGLRLSDEALARYEAGEIFGIAKEREWNEDAVTRDENGRFSSGGGGGSGKSDSKKEDKKLVLPDAPYGSPNYSLNPRPGMGDIEIDENMVSDFTTKGGTDNGGSATPYLIQHPDGSVSFNAERQELHDSVVEQILASAPVANGQPSFVMLGGGAASGKSTISEDPEWQERTGILPFVDISENPGGVGEAVLINPDVMKAMLPGYEEGIASRDTNIANFFHEESSYLAKRATDAALDTGRSIVLDGVNDGSAEKVEGKLDAARDSGYRLIGAYVTADTGATYDRALTRGEAMGRYVDPTEFLSGHQGVSQIFPDISDKFDSITLVDTNGRPPIVIGSGEGGQFNVSNPELYQRFLDKADYTPPALLGKEKK